MTQHSKISSVRCNQSTDDRAGESFHIGSVDTPIGKIPRVGTELQFADRLGEGKVRWGIGRKRYRVTPGLYAVGFPTPKSPVLVSANYKLSFDRLRSQLTGRDAWILVLDTRGVNVWCSAGKGTFGTEELVKRVDVTCLSDVITHRRLILPQLSATGVSAHEVKRLSGYRVVYGPVRAEDLPAFLDAGRKATPEMRRVRFTLRDRVVLIPVELVMSAKYALLIAACIVLLSGLGSEGYSFARVQSFGLWGAVLLLGAWFWGAAATPTLLPWLPGRSFSVKSAWAGLLFLLAAGWSVWAHPGLFANWVVAASWLFIIPAVTSFLGMNFTGASTYTSLSGVRKEMRVAVPLQIGFAVVGLGLWVTGLFV